MYACVECGRYVKNVGDLYCSEECEKGTTEYENKMAAEEPEKLKKKFTSTVEMFILEYTRAYGDGSQIVETTRECVAQAFENTAQLFSAGPEWDAARKYWLNEAKEVRG